MNTDYSINDYRYYLEHSSKYDWSTGKNPPDYNHDYYEKNKERILASRAKASGKSVSEVEKNEIRNFGGYGVGYKSKTDDGKSYENDDDWSNELTDDEKKNIDAHNKQAQSNIDAVSKIVNDFINENKDKLSADQIAKLQKDLETQIEIAKEQMINTKNSDDYNYIMDLRKKGKG